MTEHTPDNPQTPLDPKSSDKDTVEPQTPAVDQSPKEGKSFTEDKTCIEPLDPRTLDADALNEEDALSLLNTSIADFEEIVSKQPKSAVSESSKDIQQWYVEMQTAMRCLVRGNVYQSALNRKDSHWRQHVEFNDQQLSAGRLLPKDHGGATLSGEAAVLKVKSILGLGTIITIPLWHSGIWVSLKAPSDAALLELNRRIASEKINLGRQTMGMVFSNTSVYIKSYLVNLVLAHIYDCSLPEYDVDVLKSTILVTDIPHLIWGILCTIYPSGYTLHEPCVANPADCQYVARAKINLTRLCWVDNSALNDVQKRHMVKRRQKFTSDEVKAYQKAYHYSTKEVSLKDGLKAVLKVPTVAQYEDSGYKWVDGIIKMTEDAFDVTLRGEQREQYIENQGAITALRQYSHWIDEFLLGDDENGFASIVDRETIDDLCNEFSGDLTIRNTLLEHIGHYIDDSSISIIGYPNSPCPSCGGHYRGEKDFIPDLIPLDIEQVFFILIRQRLRRALM